MTALPVPERPAAGGDVVRAAALVVRLATPDDLARTAAVHGACLPNGFFARLGPSFLARYHASFAASPHATLLVAERDGVVEGFLGGTVDNAEHYRFVLRRRPLGVVTSGIAALFRDGRLAAEFARTRVLRYARAVVRQLGRRTRPVAPASAGGASTPHRRGGRTAVLTHVAVAADAAGGGTGRALVDAFADAAAAAGADEIRLVTAARGQGARFYRRLGWRSRGERRGADGTVVEEFVRPL